MSKYLSTASSHSGIDILDLISLLQGSSVRTESSLGKFVHSLLRAGTTSLEHIKETSLVRRKTDDLGDKLSDHLGSLGGDSLLVGRSGNVLPLLNRETLLQTDSNSTGHFC